VFLYYAKGATCSIDVRAAGVRSDRQCWL